MRNWRISRRFLFCLSPRGRRLRDLLKNIIIDCFSCAIESDQKLILVGLRLVVVRCVDLLKNLVDSLFFIFYLLGCFAQLCFLYRLSFAKFSAKLVNNEYVYTFIVFVYEIMYLSPTVFRMISGCTADARFRSLNLFCFIIKSHKLFSIAIVTVRLIEVSKLFKQLRFRYWHHFLNSLFELLLPERLSSWHFHGYYS